ncbi:Arm DNA-binding domain-containing protein [Escherichia coli]|nr:Arm DNA-binding domain-containing protein [Escherichia coli]
MGDQLCFYYRLGGRESPPVWLTLGRYPDMSLATARRMRDQCREWLAENLDPRRQIKLAAEKTMQPVTVKGCAVLLVRQSRHNSQKRA